MYTLRCYHIESTVHREVAKTFAMHLQMSRILNIILVQAKNDEERSAIMAKGNMTIRMEPELKAQAAALFKSLGMDLSTATGIFIDRHLGVMDFPLKSRLTSRMLLPMRRWRRQKRERICMVRLIALQI